MKKKDRIEQVPGKVRIYVSEILEYYDSYIPKKEE